MFTVGSVGRHCPCCRSIYRPTLGRYIGRIAVDTRSIYRPSVGRVSVEYRSSVSRVPVEYRPILRPICVSADTVLFSSTLGRYLIDTLPIVYRYLTDTDTRTKSADQVDMSRSICRSLIARRYLRYLTFERRHKRDFQSI